MLFCVGARAEVDIPLTFGEGPKGFVEVQGFEVTFAGADGAGALALTDAAPAGEKGRFVLLRGGAAEGAHNAFVAPLFPAQAGTVRLSASEGTARAMGAEATRAAFAAEFGAKGESLVVRDGKAFAGVSLVALVAVTGSTEGLDGLLASATREAEQAAELDRTDRRHVQRRLAWLGFDPGPEDGIFGTLSRRAIGDWQQAMGLPATGFLNAAQRALLDGLGPRREIRLRYSRTNAYRYSARSYPRRPPGLPAPPVIAQMPSTPPPASVDGDPDGGDGQTVASIEIPRPEVTVSVPDAGVEGNDADIIVVDPEPRVEESNAGSAPVPRDGEPDDRMERLPWPPPEPSGFVEIPTSQLGVVVPATLGGMADVIEAALARAGYERQHYRYVAVPGGIAVLTRIEQVDAHGHPLADPVARWNITVPVAPLSLGDYLRALAFGRTGYYRFALILFTTALDGFEGRMSDEQAERIFAAGSVVLEHELRTERVSPDHRLWVLIYEFKKHEADDRVTFNEPGEITTGEHVNALQLVSGGGR